MRSKTLLLATNLVFVLLLFLILFFSEIKYQGELRQKFYPFLAGNVLVLMLLNFTYYKTQNIYQYILIGIYSISFFIFTLELFIYYISPNEFYKLINKSTENTLPINFDKRNLIDVVRDTRKLEGNAYHNYVPNLYTLHKSDQSQFPLSGLSKTLTIDCNESGYWSKFISDRYGFNNFDKNWDRENQIVMLIGDSFTQGQCVNQNSTIASLLTQKYKISSISLGKAGNGSLINLATLIEYLHIVKPKYVIWNFYEGNDIFDLANEKINPLLVNYITNPSPKGNAMNQNKLNILIQNRLDNELSSLNSNRYNSLSKFNLIDFLTFKEFRKLCTYIFSKNSIKNRNYSEEDFLLNLKIISIAKEFTEKNNSKFILVLIPDRNRFNKLVNQNDFRDRSELINFLNINKIQFIDLYSLILNSDVTPNSLYPKEGHFNPNGYEFISKSIAAKITSMVNH